MTSSREEEMTVVRKRLQFVLETDDLSGFARVAISDAIDALAPTQTATEGGDCGCPYKDGWGHDLDCRHAYTKDPRSPAPPPHLDLASLRERLRRMGVWGGDKAALATLAEAAAALEQMEKKAQVQTDWNLSQCKTIAALRAERDDLQQRVYMLETVTPTEQPLHATIAALREEIKAKEARTDALRDALEEIRKAKPPFEGTVLPSEKEMPAIPTPSLRERPHNIDNTGDCLPDCWCKLAGRLQEAYDQKYKHEGADVIAIDPELVREAIDALRYQAFLKSGDAEGRYGPEDTLEGKAAAALERATEIIAYMNKKASDDAGELTAACATIAALRDKIETSEAINRKLEEDRGALEANNRALRDALEWALPSAQIDVERLGNALSSPSITMSMMEEYEKAKAELVKARAALSNTARRGE